MKFYFVTILLCSGLIAAQEVNLPADARSLLEQLEKYEKNEREQTEKRISRKRTLVAESLKKMLDRETRAGRLENALEIRAKIANLEPAPEKPEQKKPEPFQIAGTSWEAVSGPHIKRTIHFLHDGAMQIDHGAGSWTDWKWDVIDGKVTVKNPQFDPEVVEIKSRYLFMAGAPGAVPTKYQRK